jgi:hypothetical protein
MLRRCTTLAFSNTFGKSNSFTLPLQSRNLNLLARWKNVEPKTTETTSTTTIEPTPTEESTSAKPETPSKMHSVRERIASGREKLTVAIEADRNRM